MDMLREDDELIRADMLEITLKEVELILAIASPVLRPTSRVGEEDVIHDHIVHVPVIEGIGGRAVVVLKGLIRVLIIEDEAVDIHIVIAEDIVPGELELGHLAHVERLEIEIVPCKLAERDAEDRVLRDTPLYISDHLTAKVGDVRL